MAAQVVDAAPSGPPTALRRLHLRCDGELACPSGVGMVVGPPAELGPDGQPNRCTGALIAPTAGTRLCRVRTVEEARVLFGPEAERVGWLSDCPAVPGNSGAPVLDYHGRVRGILHGGSAPVAAIGVTTPLPPTAAPSLRDDLTAAP